MSMRRLCLLMGWMTMLILASCSSGSKVDNIFDKVQSGKPAEEVAEGLIKLFNDQDLTALPIEDQCKVVIAYEYVMNNIQNEDLTMQLLDSKGTLEYIFISINLMGDEEADKIFENMTGNAKAVYTKMKDDFDNMSIGIDEYRGFPDESWETEEVVEFPEID